MMVLDTMQATVANESLFMPVLSALGALAVIVMGWGVSLLRSISSTQTKQGTAITRIETKLGEIDDDGLVGKVARMHAWKQKEQERQLNEANAAAAKAEAELDRMRNVAHLHARREDER